MTASESRDGLERFAIGFDHRDRGRLHELWDSILDNERWSEGELTSAFEASWGAWNGLEAVAFNGWTGAALAALEWAGVRGETVLCPSNTFMATPLSIIASGGQVGFVDCNREDLCMSADDLERKVAEHKPRAVFLVHIGGHIAFDSERIASSVALKGSFCSKTAPTLTGPTGMGASPAHSAMLESGRSLRRKRFRQAKGARSFQDMRRSLSSPGPSQLR